ncbi:MAG: DNA translocase FtsK [Tindallia sp. MSAO_Bac2]|nr:MAG: DNA translocase FtsK [Tindallia sp. MSAO_Bac2]
MRKTSKKKKSINKYKSQILKKLRPSTYPEEIRGILLLSFSVLLLISLHSNAAGLIGSLLRDLFMGFFSLFSYFFSYALLGFSILYLLKKKMGKQIMRRLFTLTIILIYTMMIRGVFDRSITSVFEIHHFGEILTLAYNNGLEGIGAGAVPAAFHYWIFPLLGVFGTLIMWTALASICIFLITPDAYNTLEKNIKKYFLNNNRKEKQIKAYTKPNQNVKDDYDEETLMINELPSLLENDVQRSYPEEQAKIINYEKELQHKDDISQLSNKSKTSSIEINLPPIEILSDSATRTNRTDRRKVIEKAKMLEDALRSFGVETKVSRVNRGPTITRYELQPSKGVKVSKIVNLSDDIALNLAASSIRIEAPIPGKAAIGIEIPNDETSLVTLKELLTSSKYKFSDAVIPFAMGKNISGEPVIFDLSKAPHMLIAGATGSGKSVCINTLILSILFKAKPDEVKLLMIDPKVVELNIYNGTPHLMIPVVTDPKKATGALRWAVTEMEERYQKFADSGVRDIGSYNEKFQDDSLPHIVVIIDELADLMLAAAKEVEDYICRLAQMARAAGIHLIIATQRPSVDVITGIIKANIPTRLAFSVASQVDSRTILDMGGAEKLLGKGDMLFHPVGASKSTRIQGAFVTEEEVRNVVNYLKSQCDEPEYEEEVLEKIENAPAEISDDSTDRLFNDALRLAYEQQQISISTLQRRFKIGYNRAARIIDEMENQGYVGPNEGTKPRKVIKRPSNVPEADD